MAHAGIQHALTNTAGAPLYANDPPVPQHPRSPPSGSHHRRPVPSQPRDHAEFAPVNVDGNRPLNGHWGGMHPPVENIAAQGQPQDLQHVDYYGMAHRHPMPPPDVALPNEYARDINNYVRVAQDVPAQAQAPAPEIDVFHYAAQHPAAAPPDFLGAWPVPNEPATEALRRLANHYLHQAGSQVYVVRMEPGRAGGVRVVITLELADFF